MGILQNNISSIVVDSDVIKRCETLLYKFIRENGPERVKRDVVSYSQTNTMPNH